MSIPLSVIVALIGLRVGDYSLNVLTLGALTIAIGRVVDDSIVVLENIKRHLGYGEDRRQAILTAVKEVAGAVTASTITTVAVFSPIALVGGLVGELFTPFALTVTVALLASLLVSLTVIPVLAYWFLQAGQRRATRRTCARAAEEKELRSPLQRAYVPVIAVRDPAAAGSRSASRCGIFVAHRVPRRPAEDELLRPVRPDRAQHHPEAAGRHQPRQPPTRPPRKVEAVLADTDGRQDLPGHHRLRRRTVRLRRAAAPTGPPHTVTITDGVKVLALQDSLRATLGALPDAGEIKVEAGGGGGFSATQLQVIVQADDAAKPGGRDRAGARRRWPATRTWPT